MNLEIINLVIGIIALLVALYAIFQTYKHNNAKVVVNDLSIEKYNDYDPYLHRFTLNNNSSKSIGILKYQIFSDKECTVNARWQVNAKIHGIGWKPAKISSGPFDLVPPNLDFPNTFQYDRNILNNYVIHANNSYEFSYYFPDIHEKLWLRLELDNRVNGLRKTVIFELSFPEVKYHY